MARGDEVVAADVRQAIGALGSDNFPSLAIVADKGLVLVRGTADRKTTKELAIGIATQVPGVLEVSDELDWQWDDTSEKRSATQLTRTASVGSHGSSARTPKQPDNAEGRLPA
jgi:BON domain